MNTAKELTLNNIERVRVRVGLILNSKRTESGCWEWQKSARSGYGCLRRYGRTWATHRLALAAKLGTLPAGLHALHACHNPACVNPTHLRAGTNADNVDDRRTAGRTAAGDRNGARTKPERLARGEWHGRARLSDAAVREIRALRAEGMTQRELGELFDVRQQTIGDVVRGKGWSHVAQPAPAVGPFDFDHGD